MEIERLVLRLRRPRLRFQVIAFLSLIGGLLPFSSLGDQIESGIMVVIFLVLLCLSWVAFMPKPQK